MIIVKTENRPRCERAVSSPTRKRSADGTGCLVGSVLVIDPVCPGTRDGLASRRRVGGRPSISVAGGKHFCASVPG
jgi:hypothetical protein